MSYQKPLPADCIGYATRRASNAVTAFYNAALRRNDLSMAQFGLLVTVRRQPGLTISGISDRVMIDESTMTRNLAVLRNRGLICIEGGGGRAGKQILLTEAGEDLAAEAEAQWQEARDRLNAIMGRETIEQGIAILERLEAAICELRQDPAPPER